MLGKGRPFVVELCNPKRRTIDLNRIQKIINKCSRNSIEVENLRFSSKDEVQRIKKAIYHKIYRVVLKGETVLNKEKLKKAALSLQGTSIHQNTPSRVSHRRVDLLREKKIYSCQIGSIVDNMAILTIETESGTYIKELVSGDNGRTTPSISEMIKIPCHVSEMDVIEIKGE
jgi:tRNA pseudouridine synthase 10